MCHRLLIAWLSCILCSMLTTLQSLKAGPLELSPEVIVARIASASVSAREISLSTQRAKLVANASRVPLDTMLSGQASYQNNRAESLGGFGSQSDQSFSLKSNLSKGLTTGTQLSAGYEFVHQEASLSPFLSNLRPNTLNYTVFSASVSQNLWRDAWGSSLRSSIEQADRNLGLSKLAAEQQMENLSLSGIELYWQAYAINHSVDKLENSVTKFTRLLAYTRERSTVGVAEIGELERVQADLEQQKQRLASAQSNFKQIVTRVAGLLKLEVPAEGVQLREEKNLGQRPTADLVNHKDLRQYRLAATQVEISQLAVQSTQGYQDPKLNIFARVASTGLDPELNSSLGEMVEISKPTLTVGLELEMFLDNYSARSKIGEKHLDVAQANLNLEKLEDDVISQDRVLILDAQSKHDSAKQADRIAKLRKQASVVLEEAFRQGRVGLDQVTLALNAGFAAEIERTQAYAQFFLARDRQLAHRNLLVASYRKSQ